MRARFGGPVVLTDVGMSKAVVCGKGYLVIEGESLFAVNGEGMRVPLSTGSAERASAEPAL